MDKEIIDNAVDGISAMLDKYVKNIHEKSEAKENWYTVTKTLYDSIAEVERLKVELHQIKLDNKLYPVKCNENSCSFVTGTDKDCIHSKLHKFIHGVCDEGGCNDGCESVI